MLIMVLMRLVLGRDLKSIWGDCCLVHFSLVFKNYQREEYLSVPVNFMGRKIQFSVAMQYHTFLKYWSVSYNWDYGDNCTFGIKSYRAVDRKDARRIAQDWMNKANVKDVYGLEDKDFRIKCIEEQSYGFE